MPTSKTDLTRWFNSGVKQKFNRMVIFCDTIDWEDHPEYTNAIGETDVKAFINEYQQAWGSAYKVMEVYDLTKDLAEQLNERRVWNY